MLSNLSKVIKGRVIQQERANDRNRLYYYLEIARTLKDNQIRRKQRGKRKMRKEGEERGRIEEEQQQQHQKRSKQDNIGNKKRKSTSMEEKEAEIEEEGRERKKQKKQKLKKEKEMQEGSEDGAKHTYSLRNRYYRCGRFKVEDT